MSEIASALAPTSDEPMIRLRELGLCYRLAKQRVASFKEYFIHFVRGSLVYEKLWALRDFNLEIGQGEIVGVVGRNGAGKSTLAKVVAGILRPTEGERLVHGSVAPLLELGTGFDFELTGYENIYLNALLLGHRRREIDQKLDAIVEFSGLKDFIHTPVRNYSTGMLARLGFSIATAWIPDILLVDEVLTVGDARFLARCTRRLQTFRNSGTTILLISHTLSTLRDYCTRCIWIDEGRLVADGPVDEILARYEAAMAEEPEPEPEPPPIDAALP